MAVDISSSRWWREVASGHRCVWARAGPTSQGPASADAQQQSGPARQHNDEIRSPVRSPMAWTADGQFGHGGSTAKVPTAAMLPVGPAWLRTPRTRRFDRAARVGVWPQPTPRRQRTKHDGNDSGPGRRGSAAGLPASRPQESQSAGSWPTRSWPQDRGPQDRDWGGFAPQPKPRRPGATIRSNIVPSVAVRSRQGRKNRSGPARSQSVDVGSCPRRRGSGQGHQVSVIEGLRRWSCHSCGGGRETVRDGRGGQQRPVTIRGPRSGGAMILWATNPADCDSLGAAMLEVAAAEERSRGPRSFSRRCVGSC